MSDADVASNAAPETVAPVSTTPETSADTAPASSNREALERQFASLMGDDAKPEAPQGQLRDEAGKFKAADTGKPDVQAPVEAAKPDEAEAVETVDPSKIMITPPARFSQAAKDAWGTTPEIVRTETERAIGELTRGVEAYQARWEPLRQFDEMAKAGGTTIHDALGRYVNLENLLRADPVAGILAVCQNMKIDPARMAEAMMAPEAGQRQRAAVEGQHARQLEQKLAYLEIQVEEQRAQHQIAAFSQVNPRMSEDHVRAAMADMLRTGYATDMQDAYDKATRIVPAAPDVSAQTIPVRPQTPKSAPKQITGSPSGSNPATRPIAGSSREALLRARAAVGLS